jgi:ABC-2 type transport system ATP-binding protein
VSAVAEPFLRVDNVSFSYGGRPALRDVSLSIPAQRFTALLGENGAGKTTLFALITRLLRAREGRIEICGVDVSLGGSALAMLGIVFQAPTLDLDLTVRQNLRYFAGLHGLSAENADARIERELSRLGMLDRSREKVRRLNGGHRRRVEIARALLHDPKVLLLDEPTVGLDVPTRRAIVEHVHELAERGMAILWATHLIDEIRPTDDLIILHKGRIVAEGRAKTIVEAVGCETLDQAFEAATALREP